MAAVTSRENAVYVHAFLDTSGMCTIYWKLGANQIGVLGDLIICMFDCISGHNNYFLVKLSRLLFE